MTQHPVSRSMALMATLHCLTGCAIGEIAGMMLGAHFGWHNGLTVVVAVTLAFLTGYSLSILPLIRNGYSASKALKLVFAADTLSIIAMEITDNAVMLLIPGAMDSHVFSVFFWVSMTIALAVAFVVAYPVNLYLLSKGKGHALTHHAHHGHGNHGEHMHGESEEEESTNPAPSDAAHGSHNHDHH